MSITNGAILGSVYGGGRLASVGTQFDYPEDPNYGNFVEDGTPIYYTAEEIAAAQEGDDAYGKTTEDVKTPADTYGHITINISGGTIGNTVGNAVSGNVFGGSMGRLTLLNGSTIPIWPKMAQVKSSTITVSDGAIIKRTVFGGGELGTVRDNTIVNITGGTVGRDVYGGGYGSDDYNTMTIFTVKELENNNYVPNTYAFTPMIFAGCVGKSTQVNVSGGQVKKSVYGGGEMASVGIIDCRVETVNSEPGKDRIVVGQDAGKYTVYKNMFRHWNEAEEFALSWPYKFNYVPSYPGNTHVKVTGGRLGLYGTETNPFEDKDNGDVVGGGKGKAGDFEHYLFCANVGSTDVTIEYPSTPTDPASVLPSGDCISGAAYGGAENGHVMGNTKLTLKNGLIGHSVFGGGSGKGTYPRELLKIGKTEGSTNSNDYYTREIYSITAGKVFGNTEVIMEDGYVVRNVYGGGNMGSVGKGNYAGGTDDYSYYAGTSETHNGYGEALTGKLWETTATAADPDNAWHFLNSGRSSVRILKGTVGYINSDYSPDDSKNNMYGGLPYGNVFGGCRGEAAPNIDESPRYLYCPEFFVGYANETDVTIGAENSTTGPKIIGSVYGGGMDGHVRRDTKVTINSGEIGLAYNETNQTALKTTDQNDILWLGRGNVYGAGSGIGKYKYDFDYDDDYNNVTPEGGQTTYHGNPIKEEDFSTSAGSVTRFTTVDVKGGTIHRNVYGGGSLSSVGAPKIPVERADDPILRDDSESGKATQGKQSLNKVTVSGGHVGDADGVAAGYGGEVNGGSRGDITLGNRFSTAVYTDVTIQDNADVKGNVFGGGEAGIVKHDTEVKMKNGTVGKDLYGGGNMANVNGNTKVSLTGGVITHDAYGGARGTASVAANVGGNVLIELNNGVAEDATGCVVDRIFGANNVNGTPKGSVTVHVYATQNADAEYNKINLKYAKATDDTPQAHYDVAAVYGGGNQSAYEPTDEAGGTNVIIDGCELTSIQQVYGGGNAASTPATNVTVNGTYEIEEVFGGGNGKDPIDASTPNPGANVGFKDYHLVENTYNTKEIRTTDNDFLTNYVYGSGKAAVNIFGGLVHRVFGGSNTKGNVRETAVTMLQDEEGCEFHVDEAYGGGKSAPMDAEAKLLVACIPGLKAAYGGAEAADIQGGVTLNITNGTFERVFGGNNRSGTINGPIVVNIEETGCKPIIIGELYGGGNLAAYSVFGYNEDKTPKLTGTTGTIPFDDPQVNVKSFTSIGSIFGGGYGTSAVMVGNPTVNINVASDPTSDAQTKSYTEKDANNADVIKYYSDYAGETMTIDGHSVILPSHAKGKMGAINNVFGGGNAAKVIGNTNVNVGTRSTVTYVTGDKLEHAVVGADIRGNVYGGGNAADVTGKTNVKIGKEE